MVHALRLSRSHRQDKEQRSSSLAASLCPLFHPRVFNPIHFLSLSLSFSRFIRRTPPLLCLFLSRSLLSFSFTVLVSFIRVVHSLSSREIIPSSSTSLLYSHGVSHACIHPLARPRISPLRSRSVHARASNAGCHAYPFCIRVIDTREKLSLGPSFRSLSLSLSAFFVRCI